MNTVGYGDIYPQNQIECVFTIFIMLTSGIMYAYTINEIGNIMKETREAQKTYLQDIDAINLYIKKEQVSTDLSTRIQNYLLFLRDHDNEILKKRQDIVFNKLPSTLQKDLKNEVMQKYIKNIKILDTHFSVQSIQKLIPYMREIRYAIGDTLFREKEIDDGALYFIVSGEIGIYYSRRKILKQSQKPQAFKKVNQYLGELSFFTKQPREYTAKASSFSRAYKIERDSFIKIIKNNPQDFQSFCQIRDDIMMQNKPRLQIIQRDFAHGGLNNIQKLITQNSFRQQQNKDITQKQRKYSFVQQKTIGQNFNKQEVIQETLQHQIQYQNNQSPYLNNNQQQHQQQQQIQIIQNEILLQNNILNCHCCQKKTHLTKDCPDTHLVLNKFSIYDKINQTIVQDRNPITIKRCINKKSFQRKQIKQKAHTLNKEQTMQTHIKRIQKMQKKDQSSHSSSDERSFSDIDESNSTFTHSNSSSYLTSSSSEDQQSQAYNHQQNVLNFNNQSNNNNSDIIENQQNSNESFQIEAQQQKNSKKLQLSQIIESQRKSHLQSSKEFDKDSKNQDSDDQKSYDSSQMKSLNSQKPQNKNKTNKQKEKEIIQKYKIKSPNPQWVGKQLTMITDKNEESIECSVNSSKIRSNSNQNNNSQPKRNSNQTNKEDKEDLDNQELQPVSSRVKIESGSSLSKNKGFKISNFDSMNSQRKSQSQSHSIKNLSQQQIQQQQQQMETPNFQNNQSSNRRQSILDGSAKQMQKRKSQQKISSFSNTNNDLKNNVNKILEEANISSSDESDRKSNILQIKTLNKRISSHQEAKELKKREKKRRSTLKQKIASAIKQNQRYKENLKKEENSQVINAIQEDDKKSEKDEENQSNKNNQQIKLTQQQIQQQQQSERNILIQQQHLRRRSTIFNPQNFQNVQYYNEQQSPSHINNSSSDIYQQTGQGFLPSSMLQSSQQSHLFANNRRNSMYFNNNSYNQSTRQSSYPIQNQQQQYSQFQQFQQYQQQQQLQQQQQQLNMYNIQEQPSVIGGPTFPLNNYTNYPNFNNQQLTDDQQLTNYYNQPTQYQNNNLYQKLLNHYQKQAKDKKEQQIIEKYYLGNIAFEHYEVFDYYKPEANVNIILTKYNHLYHFKHIHKYTGIKKSFNTKQLSGIKEGGNNRKRLVSQSTRRRNNTLYSQTMSPDKNYQQPFPFMQEQDMQQQQQIAQYLQANQPNQQILNNSMISHSYDQNSPTNTFKQFRQINQQNIFPQPPKAPQIQDQRRRSIQPHHQMIQDQRRRSINLVSLSERNPQPQAMRYYSSTKTLGQRRGSIQQLQMNQLPPYIPLQVRQNSQNNQQFSSGGGSNY